MIVELCDLHKVSDPESFSFKVFNCYPKPHYRGFGKVVAKDMNSAKEALQAFRDSDPNNVKDSWGWCNLEESYSVSDEDTGVEVGSIYYWG